MDWREFGAGMLIQPVIMPGGSIKYFTCEIGNKGSGGYIVAVRKEEYDAILRDELMMSAFAIIAVML
jgi:hypothetical protein